MKKILIALSLLFFIPVTPALSLTRYYCEHADRSICSDTAIVTDEGVFYINSDGTISSLLLYHNCEKIGGYYGEIGGTPVCRAKSDNGRNIIIFKGI